jgi:nucleoside transporter
MPKFPLLCVMMFLQFFVWGSWYVTAGTFVPAMQWDQSTTGWVYSAGPIAALISPLFLGLCADRYFASQRVLAVMHALGGAIMLVLIPGAIEARDARWFEWYVLLYMLCYMPTLGLCNTVAFSHVTNPEKQFPLARVFGTLGWIAAVTLVSKGLEADTKPVMFLVAGGSSIALAVFCLVLPHTPPPAAGKQVSLGETLGLGAVGLLRDRGFAVFVGCSFLICIPLAGYYSFGSQFAATAWKNPGYYMTFGQWAEVFFMLVMPLCFLRLGVRWMLAVGMLAWVVRYGLFAAAAGSTPPARRHPAARHLLRLLLRDRPDLRRSEGAARDPRPGAELPRAGHARPRHADRRPGHDGAREGQHAGRRRRLEYDLALAVPRRLRDPRGVPAAVPPAGTPAGRASVVRRRTSTRLP